MASQIQTQLLENSSFTKQENHILNLLSDRLAKFSNHWSSDIRQMSRNLCIAISVRSLTSPVDDAEKKRQQSLKKYQEALEALRDTILPVRARGIVMLREMILARDPIMYEGDNLDHVLDIFIKKRKGTIYDKVVYVRSDLLILVCVFVALFILMQSVDCLRLRMCMERR